MERALDCTVNGILIGNYLTTIGIEPKEDIETLKNLGKSFMYDYIKGALAFKKC